MPIRLVSRPMTGWKRRDRHPRMRGGFRLLERSPMVTPIVACAVLVVSAGAAPISSQHGSAESASASVIVGATVVPFARLEMQRQKHSLTLKPEDVTRGHAEVVAAMDLVVSTNSPNGYVLNFQITSDVIWGAEILGMAREVFVGSEPVRVRQSTNGAVREKLELGFRFHLSGKAVPGVHSWPVAVTVTTR